MNPTREQVIQWAEEACDKDKVPAFSGDFWTLTQDELERFAALVDAAARAQALDEAANRADSRGHHWSGEPSNAFFSLADELRALKVKQ